MTRHHLLRRAQPLFFREYGLIGVDPDRVSLEVTWEDRKRIGKPLSR